MATRRQFSVVAEMVVLLLLAIQTASKKTVPGVPFPVDYVVAQDGSGDFGTIQEAIDSTPKNDRVSQSFIILVSRGIYNEQVVITSESKYITMVGYPGETIITNNFYAFTPNPAYQGPSGISHFTSGDPLQALNVNDTGLNKPYLGTANAGTFIVKANGFIGVGLTFVNTFGPTSQERPYAMAPAFRGYGLWMQLHYCTFLGFQDTLYAHKGIQIYKNCYISGSIDFIFGYARAWFQQCTLDVKGPDGYPGSIVAQARQTNDNYTGFVVRDSLITGYGKVNLGRAWRNVSTVLFANNYMEDVINPYGWQDFGFAYRQKTARFMEFNNTGPGANRTGRANFSEEIDAQSAAKYLDPSYIKLSDWYREPPPLIGPFTGLPLVDPLANVSAPAPAPGPMPWTEYPDYTPAPAPAPYGDMEPVDAPMAPPPTAGGPVSSPQTTTAMREAAATTTNTYSPPSPDSSAPVLRTISIAALVGLVGVVCVAFFA